MSEIPRDFESDETIFKTSQEIATDTAGDFSHLTAVLFNLSTAWRSAEGVAAYADPCTREAEGWRFISETIASIRIEAEGRLLEVRLDEADDGLVVSVQNENGEVRVISEESGDGATDDINEWMGEAGRRLARILFERVTDTPVVNTEE